jgi:heme oxygenase
MSLTQRIRLALKVLHERIENTPLAVRMQSGLLSRPEYVCLLQQLEQLHQGLEGALQRHADQYGVFRPEHARAPALQSDLAALDASVADTCRPATRRLLGLFADWSQRAPEALLGAFYVFEGSRMGSMLLLQPLAAGLGLPVEPGHGLDYHLAGLADRPRQWVQLKAQIDQLPLNAAQQERVIAAAAATMEALFDLYMDLSRAVMPAKALAS